ncbi:unnamed protein product, partial [Urochloa humidicola]
GNRKFQQREKKKGEEEGLGFWRPKSQPSTPPHPTPARKRIPARRWSSAAAAGPNPPLSAAQMASGGPALESLVNQVISVITNDGRNIVGTLRGFDQATNIILDESHERVYSTKEGVQQLVLGLYIIRGDNISVVGEVDEDLDARLDLSKLRAHPLKPVIH